MNINSSAVLLNVNHEFQGSWDPTGRYFTAVCTIGGGKGDTGYRIYTFQGRELYRKPLDRLMQFKWRPRLPVKLPDATIKVICSLE